MGDLNGISVLVTRPEEQAGALCKLIEAAGGNAVRWPQLEVQPVAEAAEAFGVLSGCDWVIFVSVNAVKYAISSSPAGAQAFAGTRIAAIGEATATALSAAGLPVDLVPKPQFNSEALLAMPEFADVHGRRIVVVKGQGGRELLGDTLRDRGAEVAYLEVYRRGLPRLSNTNAIKDLWRSGGIHVVTLTSGEAMQNLVSQLAPDHLGLLKTTPVVVLSERIADLARDLDCVQVKTAQNASDQALVDAVKEVFQNQLKLSEMNGDKPLAEEEKDATSNVQADIAATQPELKEDDVKVPVKKRAHVATWLGYLALVFVLLLAVGGFFLLQELRSKQEGLGGELNKGDQQMLEITRQITGLQTELASLHTQLANIGSQVTTEDSKFERELEEQSNTISERVAATRSDLAASIQHLQRQMNQTRGDLMVADAEYLLSVANQKLHLVGDVKAVIAMMEAADQRLHDSGDPAAFKVREALAEEIALLKAIKPVDIVGVSANLLVMETKVKALPLFLPHVDVESAAKKPVEALEGEKHVGDSVMESLKGLVTVRHTEKPIQSILEPEEVAVIREVMLLRLEMSRAALLRGDEELLHANLDSALAWLDEKFDSGSVAVKEIRDTLSGFRGLNIAIPFPDVSKSLSLLRNIEKLRVETEKSQQFGKPAMATPDPAVKSGPVQESPNIEPSPPDSNEMTVPRPAPDGALDSPKGSGEKP